VVVEVLVEQEGPGAAFGLHARSENLLDGARVALGAGEAAGWNREKLYILSAEMTLGWDISAQADRLEVPIWSRGFGATAAAQA
jgi:hypothetical protein